MGLPRILLYVVGRVMTALIAGLGIGLDYAGGSIVGLSSNNWGTIGLVAFVVFIALTIVREIELSLHPHPRLDFDGLSPATSPVTNISPDGSRTEKYGYFSRLAFKNKAKNPSGVESTAQAMTASIKVFDSKQNLEDSWEGRWANKDEPHSYGDKWVADRMDLAANNQQAILDIGLRYNGGLEFQGWDNGRYIGAPPRKSIQPGYYKLQVILAAANFKEKEYWFSLDIPQNPQSNVHNVEIKPI